MTQGQDFLIEIGVEELPSGCMPALVWDFSKHLLAQCASAGLTHNEIDLFMTPRRMAVIIRDLLTHQADREVEKRGPAVNSAFDAAGKPTPAAQGFARSCGVAFDQLTRLKTDKGEWLAYTDKVKGQATKQLMPALIKEAIKKTALPKRMRWGQGDDEFIRPVHWVCCLLGHDVVDFTLFGIQSGRETYGHRFLHPGAMSLKHPKEYDDTLMRQGKVIAHWSVRRQNMVDQLEAQAAKLGAKVMMPEALIDEVTNLVEWPVVITGEFDAEFLDVPPEVLCAVMNDHQKCFALTDRHGKLLPKFMLVSNIESQNTQRLIAGNQRVMRARMADGQFFFKADSKKRLDARIEDLKHVLYVKELGTLHDKARRLVNTTKLIATTLGEDPKHAEHIAWLAKTDLLTDMVGEFPELQGLMGYYYAHVDGLDEQVALALRDQYLPDGTDKPVPETHLGACIAIADKVDTIIGIFGINKQPTGEKDPFATRRAAIGIVRIILEKNLDMDLESLLQDAARNYHVALPNKNVVTEVSAFILDRLRAFYQAKGISVDTLNSVIAQKPKEITNLLDLDKRIHAVNIFRQMSEAASLAAANKRVSRILIKENGALKQQAINPNLFESAQEKQLAQALEEKSNRVQPYLQARDYTHVLKELSSLQQVVDDFFDHVMVMVDDEAIRMNRLALLSKLRQLFCEVADISLLHQ